MGFQSDEHKNRQDRNNKSHIFHAKILVMKDMILNIKKKQ